MRERLRSRSLPGLGVVASQRIEAQLKIVRERTQHRRIACPSATARDTR